MSVPRLLVFALLVVLGYCYVTNNSFVRSVRPLDEVQAGGARLLRGVTDRAMPTAAQQRIDQMHQRIETARKAAD